MCAGSFILMLTTSLPRSVKASEKVLTLKTVLEDLCSYSGTVILSPRWALELLEEHRYTLISLPRKPVKSESLRVEPTTLSKYQNFV